MKKLMILFLGLMILAGGELKAQYFEGGVKAGLNMAYLTFDDAEDRNILPGLHAGLYGRYRFTDQFALQPELLYSMKGTEIIYNEDFLGFQVADGQTQFKLNYLTLPVYFVFFLAEDFNFHLGPYAGLLLNAEVETDAEILDFIEIDNQDDLDKDQFNSLDYGVVGGLGFVFNKIELGFNYSLGLQRVVEEGDPLEVLLGDATVNTIQIYAGFTF